MSALAGRRRRSNVDPLKGWVRPVGPRDERGGGGPSEMVYWAHASSAASALASPSPVPPDPPPPPRATSWGGMKMDG